MADTFTPKKGVTYTNLSGSRQGVTAGPLRQNTPYKQNTYYAPYAATTGGAVGGGSVQQSSGGGGVDPYQQARDAAAQEAARREAETRNQISSGYDDYVSGLSGLENTYNSQQNDEVASNDRVYSQIFGGLDDQKKASLERLDTNRGVVSGRQNEAITGLKENLGQMIRNTGMQLGGMGAGDTSASQVMMPYAYTKIAGQEEGGIRRQANDQLFQIDQQEKDTVDKHMELWRQTEVDKENAKQQIKNFYSQKLQQIQMERINAPKEKAQALANLSQNLLSEARSRLSALDSAVLERKAQIQASGQSAMGSLSAMRQQLQNTATFTPQNINYDPLASAQVNSQATTDESYNPIAIAQKRRQQYLA